MNRAELLDLLDRIAKQLDVYEFLDVLGWSMSDLTVALQDEINRSAEDFEDALK
jgi:hypothetical protein